MKKEKVNFMDKIEFDSSEYAKQLYQKETRKLKFKIICAAISLLTPLAWAVFMFTELGNNLFVGYTMGTFLYAGIAATIISNPIQILKTTLKAGAFGWYIAPILLIDILTFMLGLAISVIALLLVPTIHCGVGVYQCYRNRKDAEVYFTLNNVEV